MTTSALISDTESQFIWPELQFETDVSSQAEIAAATELGLVGTVTLGTSLTVLSYAIWLVYSGALVASLSSLPAWRFFDPLPILEGGLGGNGEEGDTLVNLTDRYADSDGSEELP